MYVMFKFTKSTSIFVLVSFLAIVFGLTFLVGCSAKAKEFSIEDEIKITLTSDFQQSGSLDSDSVITTGVTLKSKSGANVQFFKAPRENYSDFEDINLTEFAYIDSKKTINYDKENKLCYTEEYTLSSDFTKSYYFKTNSAFYVVCFVYKKSNDDRIHSWAKTVSTTEESIYDIDESMTNTKRIQLGYNDTASIAIGTNYIKIKDEVPACYQKITPLANAYIEQCQINRASKATSGCSSLSEFAANKLGNKSSRTVGNTNIICQYTSHFTMEYKMVYEYEYYFESDYFYYTVSFITTNQNADITEYDNFAKTFSK